MLKSATSAVVALLNAGALSLGVAGCDQTSSPSDQSASTTASSSTTVTAATTSTSATKGSAAADVTRLLLEAADLPAPHTYTASAPTPNPGGTRGAEVLFVNHDQTRAIGDSIVILPDTAAATSVLQQTISSLTASMPGAIAKPTRIGHSGMSISGMPPDRTKYITILLFTEGSALARLEFDSAPGEPTSIDFATDIGQKQDIALRVGLSR